MDCKNAGANIGKIAPGNHLFLQTVLKMGCITFRNTQLLKMEKYAKVKSIKS